MSLPNIEYWNNIFPPLEPFYTAQTDNCTRLPRDAASQAAMNGQNWHLNMLKLVGSWVAKGNTDGEIRILAEKHTLPGYTVEQTWLDVQPMIASARRKNFAPANSNEAHDEPAPRKILTLISDVELKDPEYLIDDVIEEKSLIGLIGPSGSGKTFVALDIALSLATGKDYHGFDASKGLVIMSAGEGHLGIPRRAEAWCKHNRSNLHAASFAITDRAVDLFNEAPLNAFCKEVEEIAKTRGNPKLIIIDTVARHMAGKDENNAKEMGELVQTADKLKHDYQCAVMLVHHTGHNNQDRARGSTAFKGALDTEILVKSLGENDIVVSCEKQKDGPEFDTMQFLKVSVDPSLASQQVTRSVSKAKLTSNQAMAMDAFYEATKGNVAAAGLALDEWRPFFNERHTGDNQASKNTAFARARKELVDKGLIKCSDDIYRLGDKAT
ncbi:helicase RepA family protein [Planktomarina temperata]|nr:helicase RepA family protein [Planktomarina temperata]